MNREADLVRLWLYAKPGCHLCEQAEADLARLRRRYPHSLQLVDITRAAELMQAYGLRIPVLVIDRREFDAPLDMVEIERALAAASGAAPRATRATRQA